MNSDQCIHGKCHHLNTQLLAFFAIRIEPVLRFSVLCKIVTKIAFCLKLRICDNPRKVTICNSIGIFCQFLRNDLGFLFLGSMHTWGKNFFFFFLAGIIMNALLGNPFKILLSWKQPSLYIANLLGQPLIYDRKIINKVLMLEAGGWDRIKFNRIFSETKVKRLHRHCPAQFGTLYM